MTVKITINDQPIEALKGQTILDAARQHGIEIPTLCHHKDLSPVGSCRLCMVEVQGRQAKEMACTTLVHDGMVICTESPELTSQRRGILELLLGNYVDAGYAQGDRETTEFMHWVNEYGARLPQGFDSQPRYQVDADPNPFVWVDMNKCILCTRCVRACDEVQGRFVWGVAQRGLDAKIVAGTDTTMLEALCESCGACVAYCPTGALDDRMSVGLGMPDKIITTTCSYCGVGCQFDLNVKDNKIIRVTSNQDAPVNGMALCVKGRYGYDYVHHSDRLTKPLVRKYLLGQGERKNGDRGEWAEVDWETALDIVAQNFVDIKQKAGADAIGVLSSAKCTNEENYLVQKFTRQVVGTHNIDHCARL